MATIKLKGPGLNDFFAERLVKDHGPDGAREKCCGKMLEAVERVIARMGPKPLCSVGGIPSPRAVCGDVIVGGKFCGRIGECQHKTPNA